MAIHINVLLFATLKEIAGQSKLDLTLVGDTATVGEVRQELAIRLPRIEQNLKVALASVNREYAFDSESVKSGDEVAFFPPVSGGMGSIQPEIIELAEDSINHDDIIASITTSETGAVCLFSGMVRGATQKEGHMPHTSSLEYEAYAPMALEKMRQVADEIRGQWSLVQGIAIIQRIGHIPTGQNTILIACSSAHRGDGCFEAARYGIDRLKEIVPVWKKEISPEGEIWIEGQYIPNASDRKNE